jgi:hypothetical protein
MDTEEALDILKPLAERVDPFTDEILLAESLYQNPQVMRALFDSRKSVKDHDQHG